jgi:hypothetical protein
MRIELQHTEISSPFMIADSTAQEIGDDAEIFYNVHS